jgi:signal transduction histidine kinase
VIEDLLLLRKVGDSRKPLRREQVDVASLVQDAVALTAITAARQRLQVSVERPDHEVCALGERDELDKVVHNLVSNAVKYTPEGRKVHIGLRYDDGHAVVTVSDEGIGISSEDQALLFTEFFRSTNPQAVALPGTGLGLAIVKRIVERHDGTIEVDSALGRGSTFVVRLPALA